ncbi:hypothetical protein [Nocardia seriolae]|uniref:hypothetical protein n=1 Tax=Nocardia seriolae TaxID=37332 RepID=UPI00090CD18F|nr:hypothetical protein [Nocardia seriolae]WKY50217.1 hypothetical protein Q5P07_24605 [Nocardia seriolae]BAW05963.1 conserved hypothetical protein [Nocardia seriolae]BEK87286.1 hypothetical protein NSERKGN1266_32370 [Nocardia seriolae]BEK96943.1 hypothetical protein NSER024013_48490 [Nocardia seriolae]GEM24560.1 hypothetical protein NS2_27990 [Nocardia seriolae NBRC 15557]
MSESDSKKPREIAEKLLDLQVDFIVGEVSGDRFAEVIARDVKDVVGVADTIIFRDVVEIDQAKQTVANVIDLIGGSPVLGEMVGTLANSLYEDIATNTDYTLGDVVDREPVEQLLEKIFGLHQAQERLLERLTESPLIATVAAKFVDKLVDDFMETNKQIAGKIPGVGSLVSMGTNAAKSARKAAEKAGGTFIGEMAGKGAQFALKRTNNAIREMLRDAPVHDAAMEFWDLHAGEPVAGLKEYLSQQDLYDLALIVYRIALTTRNKEYVGVLVDQGVEVFFEKYGDHTLAALLPELGLSEAVIAEEILRYGPAVVEAAKRNGVLAKLIRQRLEPFFLSEPVLAVLAGN